MQTSKKISFYSKMLKEHDELTKLGIYVSFESFIDTKIETAHERKNYSLAAALERLKNIHESNFY